MHAAKEGLISEPFFPLFLKSEKNDKSLSLYTWEENAQESDLAPFVLEIWYKVIYFFLYWATFRMFRVQQDPQFCLSHLLLMVLDVTESDKCNHQSWPLRFGHARCGYFKDRKSSRTTASFHGLYWHKNSWHGIILSVLLIRGIDLTWLSSFHHCTVHQYVTG